MTTKQFRPELLDELIAGATTQREFFGPQGVLPQLAAALLQRALGAELDVHLAAENATAPAPGKARNRRNGTSAKTLQTEQGPLPLAIPRDRQSTFERLLVPKHSTRLTALDDKIIALYARGLTTRDIEAQMRDLYGVEVSPQLISEVTEAVRHQVQEWQTRPVKTLYAVLWLDALMVKAS